LAAIGAAASLGVGAAGARLFGGLATQGAAKVGLGATGQALAGATGSMVGGAVPSSAIDLATDADLRASIQTKEGLATYAGGQILFGLLDFARVRGHAKMIKRAEVIDAATAKAALHDIVANDPAGALGIADQLDGAVAAADMLKLGKPGDKARLEAVRKTYQAILKDEAVASEYVAGLSNERIPKVIRKNAERMLSRRKALQAVDSKDVNAIWALYDEYLNTPLSRAQSMPFLRPLYNATNEMGVKIKNRNLNVFATIGQNELGTLPIDQAIANTERTMLRYGQDKGFRDRINKVFEAASTKEHQEGKTAFTLEDIKKMGLDEDEAKFAKGIFDMTKDARNRHVDVLRDVSVMQTAAALLHTNPKLNPDVTLRSLRAQAPLARQAGSLLHDERQLGKFIKKLKNDPTLDPDGSQLSQAQNQVEQIKQNRRAAMEQLSENISKDMVDVKNPKEVTDRLTKALVRNDADALEYQNKTSLVDYMPMTRRKRFVVKVFGMDEDGEKTTISAVDFDSKAEADAAAAKATEKGQQVKIYDQNDLKERAMLQSNVPLEVYRNKAYQALNEAVSEMETGSEFARNNPQAFATFREQLNNFFTPLEDEIQASYQQGQKAHMLKRNYVAGFDSNDFLSNAFEYALGMNSMSERMLTRAYAHLQMSQDSIIKDKKLLKVLKGELDYTLSNSAEWAPLRRIAYIGYLGGSIRNVLLDVTQNWTNGISAMINTFDIGYLSATTKVVKATNMYRRYLTKGTTGNAVIDQHLAVAKGDPGFFPAFTDAMAPEVNRAVQMIDQARVRASRFGWVGRTFNKTKVDFARGFEQTMRLPMVFTEEFNRSVSFIAAADHLLKSGITDPQGVYSKAKELAVNANYIGTKANRPGLYRKIEPDSILHGLAATMGAMNTFTLGSVAQMANFTRDGFRGNKAAKRGARAAMLNFVLASGVTGLPILGTVNEVLGIFMKARPTDYIREALASLSELFGADEEVGGKLADAVTLGLPSLLGFDLSTSIGLGNISPIRVEDPGAGPAHLVAEGVLGPTYGIIAQGMGAMSQAWREWKALGNSTDTESLIAIGENMIRTGGPRFLKQGQRFMDALNSGRHLDRNGNPVTEQLSPGGALASIAGFTPTQASLYYRDRRLNQKLDNDSRDEHHRVAVVAARHIDAEHPDLALAAVKSYLDKNPDVDPDSFRASIANALAKHRRGEEPLPSFSNLDNYQFSKKIYGDRKNRVSSPIDRYLEQLEVDLGLVELRGKLPNFNLSNPINDTINTAIFQELGHDDVSAQVLARELRKRGGMADDIDF
jgi:hypothetical protein